MLKTIYSSQMEDGILSVQSQEEDNLWEIKCEKENGISVTLRLGKNNILSLIDAIQLQVLRQEEQTRYIEKVIERAKRKKKT